MKNSLLINSFKHKLKKLLIFNFIEILKNVVRFNGLTNQRSNLFCYNPDSDLKHNYDQFLVPETSS